MTDSGWFKVYRELFDKPIWLNSTPAQKTVLITILSMANHEAKEWEWKGKKYMVQPGQFISSTEKIAAKCGKGVTRQVVRGALARFTNFGFSTSETTNTSTLINVVNWAKYQGVNSKTTNYSTSGQPSDNQATTSGQPLTRTKELKNLNNIPANAKASARDYKQKKAAQTDHDFELLWSLYPNKKGKSVAKRHYKALLKTTKDQDLNKTIQTGIVAYTRYIKANGTEPQFVKQGGTFFSQEAWNDDWSVQGSLTISSDGQNTPGKPQQTISDVVSSYLESYRGDKEKALEALKTDKIEISENDALTIMEKEDRQEA